MGAYQEFLDRKRRSVPSNGVDIVDVHPRLFAWQAGIVRWAARKGRAAIFADCGLGKTLMQLSWARAVASKTIIFAPLCVAEQTVAEAATIGLPVHYARSMAEVSGDVVVTNYERLDAFDLSAFGAVVLDESSILKAFDGRTRTALIAACRTVPFRLCCTATPSPNDVAELANHAEFLGVMTRPEFLASWFVKVDQGLRTTEHHGWRLKGHAHKPFYRWLASWAVALRSPADLGFSVDGFSLPDLRIFDHVIPVEGVTGDALFPEMSTKGLAGRLSARRGSLTDRVEAAAALVSRSEEHRDCQWLFWCALNEEAEAVAAAVPGAVNVQGSDSYESKVAAVRGFVSGDIRHLVSKSRVLGFGMNFQHCHHQAFVGLGDSYEAYYQCVRRSWRFGQRHPVDVHVVVSEAEQGIVENVRRKEAAAADLTNNLVAQMRDFEQERAS